MTTTTMVTTTMMTTMMMSLTAHQRLLQVVKAAPPMDQALLRAIQTTLAPTTAIHLTLIAVTHPVMMMSLPSLLSPLLLLLLSHQ